MKEDERDDAFFDRCQLCFASVTSFFKLSLVFCGTIINQLLSQVNNNHFFYLTMVFIKICKEFCDDRIISRNAILSRTPRSSNLTSCDFFLWPYPKNCVCQTPVTNLYDLQQRIHT
jgi:hypothetical protein